MDVGSEKRNGVQSEPPGGLGGLDKLHAIQALHGAAGSDLILTGQGPYSIYTGFQKLESVRDAPDPVVSFGRTVKRNDQVIHMFDDFCGVAFQQQTTA